MTASHDWPPVLAVVDADGAAAADRRAIDAGVPSRALLQRAGAAAAAIIAAHFVDRLHRGVLVVTGAGNNGGDGWVIAHALHVAGIRVLVAECAAARTPDAMAERAMAIAAGVVVRSGSDAIPVARAELVIDALLGTGFRAAAQLRDDAEAAVRAMADRRAAGDAIVAIDLPSGIDATTGADAGAAPADLTVTFGTVKRGHLVARGLCGRIIVADIGLGAHAATDDDARLASPAWFGAHLPRIAAGAHKGTRGKVAIVGGGAGMAGAAILAARGALRSGAGMVRCVVAPESISAVQAAEPAAMTVAWPVDDAAWAAAITGWTDAVLVGPGLGRDDGRRTVAELLARFDGPVVLDADALNAYAGDLPALASALRGRHALLTPHPAEMGRMMGMSTDQVLAGRFELPRELAARVGAAVLLKGVPTVVASPSGRVTCVAEGTPVLASGGSGDLLGGMATALLAQGADAAVAGALAAYAHGRAASTCSARQVRGFTLDDVVAALASAWAPTRWIPHPPVLADLPAVGEVMR